MPIFLPDIRQRLIHAFMLRKNTGRSNNTLTPCHTMNSNWKKICKIQHYNQTGWIRFNGNICESGVNIISLNVFNKYVGHLRERGRELFTWLTVREGGRERESCCCRPISYCRDPLQWQNITLLFISLNKPLSPPSRRGFHGSYNISDQACILLRFGNVDVLDPRLVYWEGREEHLDRMDGGWDSMVAEAESQESSCCPAAAAAAAAGCCFLITLGCYSK